MGPPRDPLAPGTRAPRAALRVASALVVLGALALVASTYRVIGATWDEPAHIAAGMEWLARGTFDREPLTPPLARVTAALGPWLDGIGPQGRSDLWAEGDAILHAHRHYRRDLTLARLGTLPYLVFGCVLVWVWTRRLWGETAAFVSLLLFATLPPVLGHAGLAATDLAHGVTLAAAVFAFDRWLERPGRGRALALGLLVALAVLAKFTALPDLVLAGAGLAVVRAALAPRPRPGWGQVLARRARSLAWTLPALALVIWAGYHFSVDPLTHSGNVPHPALDRVVSRASPLRGVARRAVETDAWPAVDFLKGVAAVPKRNALGHKTYLLGHEATGGSPAYFPVAFAVKTPLPFLAAIALGLWAAWRRRERRRDAGTWAPLVGACAVFGVGILGNVNIGVRLIMPVFPLLAVPAGAGIVALASGGLVRVLLASALVTWQAAATVHAAPDFLATFNPLAGGHPERIVVDSDLDWGQDLPRLETALRERGIRRVSLALSGSADLARQDLPPFHPLAPHERVGGWIAASWFRLKEGADSQKTPPFDGYRWLESETPVARIGRTILLYHLPGPEPPDSAYVRPDPEHAL